MSTNALNVMTLSTALEKALIQSLTTTPAGSRLILAPNLLAQFFEVLSETLAYTQAEGFQRVAILCDARIRRELRLLIERAAPHTPVIAYTEIAPGFCIQNVRTLELKELTLPE